MNPIKIGGLAIGGVLAVLGALAFFGFHLGGSAQVAGSTGNGAETYYNSQWLVGGIQVGPTGTLNGNTQFGNCNLIGGAAGITATSTANFDCAVTGIQPGDVILEDPSNRMTLGVAGDIFPVRATASTTAGFVTFTFLNLSGAASSTLGANVTQGVEYVTWR